MAVKYPVRAVAGRVTPDSQFSPPAHPSERMRPARAHAPAAFRPHWPRSYCTTPTAAGVERIFDDPINLCILRRPRQPALAEWLAANTPVLCSERSALVDVRDADYAEVLRDLPADGREILAADLHFLCELFAVLSDSERIGVRICITHQQQCPRFHVDRVPLRLICTWQGPGTEWLEHGDVNRRYLGAGSGGIADDCSGLLLPGAHIHRMNAFDVGIMKGERWPGNAGRGIVHRSPPVSPLAGHRIMVTLDET